MVHTDLKPICSTWIPGDSTYKASPPLAVHAWHCVSSNLWGRVVVVLAQDKAQSLHCVCRTERKMHCWVSTVGRTQVYTFWIRTGACASESNGAATEFLDGLKQACGLERVL